MARLSNIAMGKSIVKRAGSEPRLVGGHYLMGYMTRGDTVRDVRAEINKLIEFGYDFFTINTTDDNDDPGTNGGFPLIYVDRVFAACRGTPFKACLSMDMATFPIVGTEMATVCTRYFNHPAYLRKNGRPVVTTFIGKTVVDTNATYWTDNLTALAAYNPLFVPCFETHRTGMVANDPPNDPEFFNPTYSEIAADYAAEGWGSFVDGMGYFESTGSSADCIASSEGYSRLMREEGKVYMATVAPSFWLARTGVSTGRRYYDRHGGEHLVAAVDSYINTQHYVPLFRWNTINDFSEGPTSPELLADLNSAGWEGGFLEPLLMENQGRAYLVKEANSAIHNGTWPAITKDKCFLFYRPHLRDDAPTEVEISYPSGDDGTASSALDVLYLRAHMRTLGDTVTYVYNGGAPVSMSEGRQNIRIAMQTGAQSLVIKRNGSDAVTFSGLIEIDATPAKDNFFEFSAYAESA